MYVERRPKTHFTESHLRHGGSAIGYTTGKALSTLLLYYAFDQGVPGEVKLAIEFICEGGLSVIGAFVSGYFKAELQ